MEKLKREGVKRLFFVKSPTQEKCRITVPSAVALLNYISRGIPWRIFSPTGTFRGVFCKSLILPFILEPLKIFLSFFLLTAEIKRVFFHNLAQIKKRIDTFFKRTCTSFQCVFRFRRFLLHSDLYIINMHGTLYFLGCRLAHLGSSVGCNVAQKGAA
jgi:hypothetical protein